MEKTTLGHIKNISKIYVALAPGEAKGVYKIINKKSQIIKKGLAQKVRTLKLVRRLGEATSPVYTQSKAAMELAACPATLGGCASSPA